MTYRWSSARRRLQKSKPNDKHFVVHHLGTPVASSEDAMKARGFVHNKVDIGFAYTTTSWTGTGKFYLNGKWTGWEIRSVDSI